MVYNVHAQKSIRASPKQFKSFELCASVTESINETGENGGSGWWPSVTQCDQADVGMMINCVFRSHFQHLSLCSPDEYWWTHITHYTLTFCHNGKGDWVKSCNIFVQSRSDRYLWFVGKCVKVWAADLGRQTPPSRVWVHYPLLLMLQFFFANLTLLSGKISADTSLYLWFNIYQVHCNNVSEPKPTPTPTTCNK